MSNERIPYDRYPTPRSQTLALLKRVSIQGTIFEPCCGEGAIVKVMREDSPAREFLTNDLYPSYDAGTHMDAACSDLWNTVRGFDWVVTNPPFNVAFPILRHAFEHSRIGVTLLLRLSFMEPVIERLSKLDRGDWLSKYPPQKMIVMPRHKYNPESTSTDSCTTAWFVWTHMRPYIGPPIEVVTKEEIKG